MAVLTIAREIGAIIGGEELTLCHALKLRCISKSTLEDRFSGLGIPRNYLERFDECKPGIIGSLTNSAGYYWETLRTIVMQELPKDNIAVFGRGGNFMLRDTVKCLRIRFIAPEAFRIKQVAKEFSISEAEARRTIRLSDSSREKFCNYYYGKSWSDPRNYDLVINTEEITLETLAEVLPPLLPPPLTDAERTDLKKTVLAQLVRHKLFSVPELQLRFPTVECPDEGVVVLRGEVPSSAAATRAEEVVRMIPEAREIRNELAVVMNDIPHRLPPFNV